MPGIFTISLDFELHWGVFDKRDRLERETCYKNTLELIPKMLELFAEFGVRVTWASVGSLFAKNEQEWNQLKPTEEPHYTIEKYSPYTWVRTHGLAKEFNWAHFAPQLINDILSFPGQELGSHTFGHYYCLEQQANGITAFVADLKAAQHAAARFNTQLTSLVFPRNQFNPSYLKACFEQGITAVRSNPSSWFWSPVTNTGSSIVRKIFRTLDGYFTVGKRTSYPLDTIKVETAEPLLLPASRFLRLGNPKYGLLNNIHLQRVSQEIYAAAKKQECYHLWWHPENFGYHPAAHLESLRYILEQYRKCQLLYSMQSWNMGDYAQNLMVNKRPNATHSYAS